MDYIEKNQLIRVFDKCNKFHSHNDDFVKLDELIKKLQQLKAGKKI